MIDESIPSTKTLLLHRLQITQLTSHEMNGGLLLSQENRLDQFTTVKLSSRRLIYLQLCTDLIKDCQQRDHRPHTYEDSNTSFSVNLNLSTSLSSQISPCQMDLSGRSTFAIGSLTSNQPHAFESIAMSPAIVPVQQQIVPRKRTLSDLRSPSDLKRLFWRSHCLFRTETFLRRSGFVLMETYSRLLTLPF